MKSTGKRRIGKCVHCGNIRPLTDDHVPPQNLFSRPLPQNMITVYSCDDCNRNSSKDDEYFRAIMTLRNDTFEHPDVKKLWPKIWKSLSRPFYGGLRKAVLRNFQELDTWTKSGLYLGKTGSYEPDEDRVKNVLTKVINGIIFNSLNTRLPNNYERRWYYLNYMEQFKTKEQKLIIIDMLKRLQSVKRETIGDNVFSYNVLHTKEDDFCTIGLMIFYGKVAFLFVTLPYQQMG